MLATVSSRSFGSAAVERLVRTCWIWVTALYWNGLYLSFLLSLLSFVWFSNAHRLLTALALPSDVIADTQRCLDIMRWAEPANLIALGLMRGVLPAFGLARILYVLTPATIVIYAVIATALAQGAFGLPPMGWVGIPVAFVAAKWLAALVMLATVHATRCRRHIPLAAPRFSVLGPMLRVGVPFGVVQRPLLFEQAGPLVEQGSAGVIRLQRRLPGLQCRVGLSLGFQQRAEVDRGGVEVRPKRLRTHRGEDGPQAEPARLADGAGGLCRRYR